MNYFAKLIKIISIRVFSFSFAFIVGLVIVSRSSFLGEEAKIYLVKTEIFKNNVRTEEDCKTPNPLILQVFVDNNTNVRLNHEEFGNLEDTTRLEKFLIEVFEERTNNLVYKTANNFDSDSSVQIEKEIIIRPNDSIKFGELNKLVEILNRAGANRVILDPSDEYCYKGGGGSGGKK
jgi:hypothetical protein